MTNELTAKTFDYSTIDDKDVSGKLLNLEGVIKRQFTNGVREMLEVGRNLIAAQELLANHGDGTFNRWIETGIGVSRKTAYQIINSTRQFGGDCNPGLQIEVSAMYALASPSTPKPALTEAKKLADKGVKVTAKVAKAIIKKYKPPKAESNGRTRSSSAPVVESKYGKCPNCAGTKWTEDENGVACAKCHHPHGEPVGDVDESRIGIQRSKTVKTVEALMRAFDDLNQMMPKKSHSDAIVHCKLLLTQARNWK